MNKVDVKLGGKHDVTAALTNVLAAHGILAPHNGQPFSEAMMLGIGGGLGMGYILWEFKRHESANVVLGFRNHWNYIPRFLTTLCARLGIQADVQETAGAKAAAANLENAQLPVVAWVDQAHLPHQNLPEWLKGYWIHVVGVYGIEAGQVWIDDLSPQLFAVPADVFAAGRARIGSDKNRLMLITPPSAIDLESAIIAGLHDHIDHLSSDSESFSLPAIKKWAKLMTHPKDKKSWRVVFKERNGLYTTLRSVYEGITLNSTEGSGLRDLYADFLEEASAILGNAALKESAAHYREAAACWRDFADSALPESVPDFAETKSLMRDRYALYQAHDSAGMQQVSAQLNQIENDMKHEFPMDSAEVDVLFETLQAKLNTIYEAEVQALESLKQSL